jgi:hypothetical protein
MPKQAPAFADEAQMFILSRKPNFSTKVEISIPDDIGRSNQGSFTATFRHVTLKRYLEIVAGLQSLLPQNPNQFDLEQIFAYKQKVLKDELVSVEGLGDEEGQLPPQDQRLFVLGESPIPGSMLALNATYDKYLEKLQEQKAKNSNTPRGS